MLSPFAPHRSSPCFWSLGRVLRRLARLTLPSLTSPRSAIESLADGYERLAWRALADGRAAEASLHQACACALRNELRQSE